MHAKRSEAMAAATNPSARSTSALPSWVDKSMRMMPLHTVKRRERGLTALGREGPETRMTDVSQPFSFSREPAIHAIQAMHARTQ